MSLKTDLDVYNFVVAKLLEQSDKSMDTYDTCQYRGVRQSLLSEIQEKVINKFPDVESIFEHDEAYEEYTDLVCSLNADAKCAVGHLIADEHYDIAFEGSQIEKGSDIWEAVLSSNPEWEVSDYSFHLLNALQKIHDSHSPIEWESLFEELLDCFNGDGEYDPTLTL